MDIIKPRILGGFPEFNPAQQVAMDRALRVIRRWYERFGFVPLETSAVEPKDVLTAKASTVTKQIYTLSRLAGERELNETLDRLSKKVEVTSNDLKELRGQIEHAQTDMALHFDLTMPLAHYVVKHKNDLAFPFRRYQMQKVWRGERQQSGRFREFYQCDIDVVGQGSLNILVDAEIPSIIYGIFQEMSIGKFVIRINNAKILEEYLRYAGINEDLLSQAKDTIDNLVKVGTNRTVAALAEIADLSLDKARDVITFLVSENLSTDQILQKLRLLSISERFSVGVQELSAVIAGVRMFGIPDDYFQADLTIARGLDYYTGTVYETVLVDHPGIGSICSGGRYDDLASHFSSEKFPGVGISIGLTRLMSRLLSAGLVKVDRATTALALVTSLDRTRIQDYINIANAMRAIGIDTEVYLDDAKIGQQLRYANKKGFLVAIIAGDRELDQGIAQIKNLSTGTSSKWPLAEVAINVQHILNLIQEENGGR